MGIQDAVLYGQYLFTCGQDKTLKVWDKRYRVKNPQVFPHHSSQVRLLFRSISSWCRKRRC